MPYTSVVFTAPTTPTNIGETMTLKCSQISFAGDRLPSQNPLPGDTLTGIPKALVIDLGVQREIITFDGIVDLVPSDNTTSFVNAYDYISKWWRNSTNKDATVLSTNFTKLQISLQGISPLQYFGVFKMFSFVIIGGQDDRLNFSIQFMRRRIQATDG